VKYIYGDICFDGSGERGFEYNSKVTHTFYAHTSLQGYFSSVYCLFIEVFIVSLLKCLLFIYSSVYCCLFIQVFIVCLFKCLLFLYSNVYCFFIQVFIVSLFKCLLFLYSSVLFLFIVYVSN